MDHALIRSQMPTLVAGHVPRNARSFKFNVYDGTPQKTMLGFAADPIPFQGKVIAVTDDAIVVKVKPTQIAVVDRHLSLLFQRSSKWKSFVCASPLRWPARRTPREKTEYLPMAGPTPSSR